MDKNTENTEKRLANLDTAMMWLGDAKEWMDVAERLDRESGRGQEDNPTNHHKLNVSHACTGVAFELAYKSLLVAELKLPKKTQRIEKLHKILKAETQRTIEDWIKEAGWEDSGSLLKYLDEYMVLPDRKYSMENARQKEQQSPDFTLTGMQAIPKLAPILYKLADLGKQNLAKAKEMSTLNQPDPQNDRDRILEIIREIVERSASGDYIYRGEPEQYDKVSSTLYREYEEDIEAEYFDIEVAQKEMLNVAKKHTGHPQQDLVSDLGAIRQIRGRYGFGTPEFEILTELQHYGGDTNLIDFTTDYFIALFFACDGHHDEDGRIILRKTENIKDMIRPQNPRHRVIAQKSVFVRPPKGFIEPLEDDIVTIPANLKQPILQYLRKYHDISMETIYNDLHGFIRVQHLHQSSYTEFYKGFTCQYREQHDKAIEYYTKAIELKPDFAGAYYGRGVTRLCLGEWENAKADLTTAKEKGVDIADEFRMDYESVSDFEGKHDIQLPKDIAVMLTEQS